MKNVDWPQAEVAKVAASSGKPLEVSCAQAFIGAGWAVDLGSYFTDGSRVREFDVLATRESGVEVERHVELPLRVRALVSCKGFRPTCSPLAYSVSKSQVPPCAPRIQSHHRINGPLGYLAESYGRLEKLERAAAAVLLDQACLTSSRPLVAFDVIEREESKKSPPTVTFKSVGDSTLYEGIDSALKAASCWTRLDNQTGIQCVTLYVPILVVAFPFWDVCIDGGNVGVVETLQRGYHSCRYPIQTLEISEVTTFVWSVDALPSLLLALDALVGWFRTDAASFLSSTHRR